MELTPFNAKRFTESKLYTAVIESERKILIKEYIGNRASDRKDLESRKLSLWRKLGFSVPEILPLPIEKLEHPYLVLNFVEGKNLGAYLKDSSHKVDSKIQLLDRIFIDNAKRHQLCLNNNDYLLIHSDPNMDNIIITEETFYFIDFEHFSKVKAIDIKIAKEVACFMLKAANELGKEHLDKLIVSAINAYSIQKSTLELIVKHTLGRPFQFIHKLKNMQKLQKNPLEVTRYDVAEAISKKLSNPSSS